MPDPLKSAAWDEMGSLFWTHGRASARPQAGSVDLYLDGTHGRRCALIGASTKVVAQGGIARGADMTVLDFSQGMLSALAGVVGNACRYVQCDIVGPFSPALAGRFDVVLADRLINRFEVAELPVFARNVLSMLGPGGELRTAVKLGFYPMDLALLEEGRRSGTLERFYDERTRTIDYSRAEAALEAAVLPHGSIPRDALLRWYRGRGRESATECLGGLRFTDVQVKPYPDEADTVMFVAITDQR